MLGFQSGHHLHLAFRFKYGFWELRVEYFINGAIYLALTRCI